MGFIVAAIVGIGAALGAGAIAATLATIGITVAASTIAAIGISLALSAVSGMLLGPKVPESQLSRLNVTLEPTTPRKAVFGTTAMNLDLRYHEASGTNQEYIDYVIAVAAHKVKSINEIWFEEKLAWSSTSGVTATYSGYLTVSTILEGSSTSYFSINGGAKWGSSERLTGCAQVRIRIKRSGPDDQTQSPLINGLPNRITIIGDGALLYDPRKDSTVTGGSGTHRANDQSTWGTYTNADDTDNPVLQLLWYLLGWKINSQLSIGCGVPPERIDLESFITAANICDENVTLNGGGTQKRYRTSGTVSDSDNRMDVINTFLACMNASLRDNAGKLALTIIKNDLADYVLTFNDGDVLGEFEWNQTRGLSESYNKARGRYVDPSNNSLYQLVDYPEVGFASPDGIDRVMTLDLPFVEDGRRAQRIAKQVLQRNQYKGTFSAIFTAKAQGCTVGEVVRMTFAPLGWTNKLFRVISQEIRFDGQVPMALVEENSAIYAWDAEETAPVSPNAPTVYDPLNNPYFIGIESAGQTAQWSAIIDDDGGKTFVEDGATAATNGLNSDGTVKTDKVTTSAIVDNAITAALLDGSVIQEIQYGSATNVTATDAGAVLVTVTGIAAKPSQGGKVILLVTADCEATTSKSKDYHIAWAILQRKTSSGSTWTQVGSSWRLFYLGAINTFIGYDGVNYNATVDDNVAVVSGGYALMGSALYGNISGHKIGCGAANQWIDEPPSDGDYDYRVLLCSANTPGTQTTGTVGFATAKTAEMQAISVKVTN